MTIDVIKLARECGVPTYDQYYGVYRESEIRSFANAVLEEAAKRCEQVDSMASSNPPMLCAKAIREMKK